MRTFSRRRRPVQDDLLGLVVGCRSPSDAFPPGWVRGLNGHPNIDREFPSFSLTARLKRGAGGTTSSKMHDLIFMNRLL